MGKGKQAASSELKKLAPAASVVVSLAVVVLVGIAIITQLKTSSLISNTTADNFIDGLTYFGTFLGVIVIGLVGWILIGMFRK